MVFPIAPPERDALLSSPELERLWEEAIAGLPRTREGLRREMLEQLRETADIAPVLDDTVMFKFQDVTFSDVPDFPEVQRQLVEATSELLAANEEDQVMDCILLEGCLQAVVNIQHRYGKGDRASKQ